MYAGLPMYDRPENAADHDILWGLIRDGLRERGLDAPQTLDRGVDYFEGWGRSDLVLGQICNLPYRARFRGKVTLIGASDYGLDDCPPGYYRSHFVVRRDDAGNTAPAFSGRRFAYSDGLSHSGWGSAWAWAQANGVVWNAGPRTGSHVESVRTVARGEADIAAIDAQTWRMLERSLPEAAVLKIVGHTDVSPGMSFITRTGQDPLAYRGAIASAIAALPPDSAGRLGLRGIVDLGAAAYDIPLPPAP